MLADTQAEIQEAQDTACMKTVGTRAVSVGRDEDAACIAEGR